ncbi:hypothetical protein B0H13DRAFT_525654 [Mycena leptocephala]|nr:hypothetical protein B0H13DRAFT_525654 [Mycena leptocephala]
MPIELIPLPRLPLGDESNTRIRIGPPPSPRFHKFSGSVELNDHSTIRTTSSSPTILTRSQELDFVEQILASIMTASLDINSLHARFSALPKPNPADRALCDKVGEGLHAVQESLSRHRVFPPEQWSLRSSSCRRKYECRLMSLQRRTLRRLHILSAVSPRINQLTRFRKLLEQYDTKLSDLAVKFNSMFDRLYDRHWNITLTSVLVDIDRRVAARKLERKTARAARLHDYPFYRNGRRPSMMEVS